MDFLDKEKTRRLLEWSRGNPRGPFKIDVELHRRCNLKCLSCSRRSDKKYDFINEFSKTIEMPAQRWLDVVDEAASAGVWEWHVAGGGDPPFVPELTFPVLERIKKRKMFGILTTNGTNLPKSRLELLAGIGWDRVHFSIDGPDAKTHDFLRVIPGTFRRATAAMRTLDKLKQKAGTGKPEINMNTVLSKHNYDRLPELVRLAARLGVGYMFVEPMIVYSDTGAAMKLGPEERKRFRPFLEEASELARKSGINGNFTNLVSNLQDELIEKSSSMHEVVKKDSDKFAPDSFLSIPCYDPFFHMTIKADGRVISCDVATDEGDSIRKRPLADIWRGGYFERLRAGMLSRLVPDFCAQCNPSHTTQRRWLREMMEKV